MAFSYDKLWKLLIDKKMTKEKFRLLIKASPTPIAEGKGEGISPKVLDRICTAYDCQPGDIWNIFQITKMTKNRMTHSPTL